MQVLELAQEMKLLKIGRVCLDGTKIHANASKHQALSHGHIEQMERHLQAEVQERFALAEQADQTGIPEGVNAPRRPVGCDGGGCHLQGNQRLRVLSHHCGKAECCKQPPEGGPATTPRAKMIAGLRPWCIAVAITDRLLGPGLAVPSAYAE